MKTSIFITLFCTFSVFATAQYEFSPDEHKGEIYTIKEGTRTGYIDLKGSDRSPWANQQSVRFFSEDALADNKVKGKEKEKYKPKQLKGYLAGDRYFESIKISPGKVKMGIGMASQKFVERLAHGKIKLYKLYEAPDPAGVYVGEEEIAAHEADLERMRNEPIYVLQHNGGNYQTMKNVNLEGWLSDCPEVLEKYKSGGYGIEPFNQDAKTGLGKSIAQKVNAERMEVVLAEILRDYNACMK